MKTKSYLLVLCLSLFTSGAAWADCIIECLPLAKSAGWRTSCAPVQVPPLACSTVEVETAHEMSSLLDPKLGPLGIRWVIAAQGRQLNFERHDSKDTCIGHIAGIELTFDSPGCSGEALARRAWEAFGPPDGLVATVVLSRVEASDRPPIIQRHPDAPISLATSKKPVKVSKHLVKEGVWVGARP